MNAETRDTRNDSLKLYSARATRPYAFDAIAILGNLGAQAVYGAKSDENTRRTSTTSWQFEFDGGNSQLPLSIGESASRFAWSFQSIRRRSTSDPLPPQRGYLPYRLARDALASRANAHRANLLWEISKDISAPRVLYGNSCAWHFDRNKRETRSRYHFNRACCSVKDIILSRSLKKVV